MPRPSNIAPKEILDSEEDMAIIDEMMDEEKTAITTEEARSCFNMYTMFATSKVIREWWMKERAL